MSDAMVRTLATVLQVTPTGERAGALEEMRLELQRGGPPAQRVKLVQFLRHDQQPQPGDVVSLAADPSEPDRWMLTGSVEAIGPPKPQQELQAMLFTAHLRDNGRLGIASVLDVSAGRAGLTRFGLAIEAIGQPRRHVSLLQAMPGNPYEAGDRVYLLVDPENADGMAILPIYATGGQKLPAGMSRLDPYVLGPALLHGGARGTGYVLVAESMPLGNAELEARGFMRFRLRVRIEPEDGSSAYEAEQEITLTSPEKVARMAHAGAVLPVRYDPAMRESFATDSLAMGYPDPYEETLAIFRSAVRQG